MIIAVGIVGRDNEPLWIHEFKNDRILSTSDDDNQYQLYPDNLLFQFSINCALDIIEEKLNTEKALILSRSQQHQQQVQSVLILDPYIGYLGPFQEYHTYGYLSASYIKVIVVLSQMITKENDMKTFLKKIYDLYIDIISNPFYTNKLSDSSFLPSMETLIHRYNNIFQSS